MNKLIEENKLPHLLFYGPPGTGKTSTCLAIAKKLYGKNYRSMVLEVNFSSFLFSKLFFHNFKLKVKCL